MKTIGEFSIGDNTLNDIGQAISQTILNEVNSGELNIDDDQFKEFLCCIFAEGNFEYLKVIANNYYTDTRKDIILDFIRIVEEMTKYGENSLRTKGDALDLI